VTKAFNKRNKQPASSELLHAPFMLAPLPWEVPTLPVHGRAAKSKIRPPFPAVVVSRLR
jgi:hypothetical protein